MTIIYYLGLAQYNGGIKEPSKHLRDVFNRRQDEDEPDTDTEVYDDDGENGSEEEYLSMI